MGSSRRGFLGLRWVWDRHSVKEPGLAWKAGFGIVIVGDGDRVEDIGQEIIIF